LAALLLALVKPTLLVVVVRGLFDVKLWAID
jgi:hypothetical protein